MKNIIADHNRGTTWDGISITIQDEITLLPIDLTGFLITANFQVSKDRESMFNFTTENGNILVPNPLDGTFILKKDTPIDYKENTYIFTVTLHYPDGLRVEEIISDYWKIY